METILEVQDLTKTFVTEGKGLQMPQKERFLCVEKILPGKKGKSSGKPIKIFR